MFLFIFLNLVLPIRQGHAHVFQKRPGQLLTNRIKDIAHFYLIGVGALPCAIIVIVSHIFYSKFICFLLWFSV